MSSEYSVSQLSPPPRVGAYPISGDTIRYFAFKETFCLRPRSLHRWFATAPLAWLVSFTESAAYSTSRKSYLELLGPRTVALALRENLSEPEIITMKLDVDGGQRHIEANSEKGI